MKSIVTKEQSRLDEARNGTVAWKKWGPYLSERQWGTVREDYSEGGDAWNYFTHDQARSRTYRWGEDGLGGISDDRQHLCFALALWNGRDPILKERLFGLTNTEANHGEDVKEYYFYLDSTPTHSYMKYLYKYPQSAFPYEELVKINRRLSRTDFEYELLDTGVFYEDRYFDVFVEYAKASPEDILIRITAINRGPDAAELHMLPTLWFRNDWAEWLSESAAKPVMREMKSTNGFQTVLADHAILGNYKFLCEGNAPLLFTDNVTNRKLLNLEGENEGIYLKDGINNYVVLDQHEAINPAKMGTKMSAHYKTVIGPGETATVRLRLVSEASSKSHSKDIDFADFDAIFDARVKEADEFYKSVTPSSASTDEAAVMRQAIAGMLWSKQYYLFDGQTWLEEHRAHPLYIGNRPFRNSDWFHMHNDDIFSMPDKWEYPWYAAWDLAFHTLPLSIVDPDFAKQQMKIMFSSAYVHPSGQVPAYEWNFSDVTPPVHAWATLFLYLSEEESRGKADTEFLKLMFNKLLLNFTWWVNRKDRFGKNIFEGGFLGLDNIGVFDRSAPLPTGGYLEQADGTAWMAFYCQNMLELAIELSVHDNIYEDMVVKFVEHFTYIAAAMNRSDEGMWDEEDGFYYDMLRYPNGKAVRLKVRSIVGLLPFCAATVVEQWQLESNPRAMELVRERQRRMPKLMESIHPTGPGDWGINDRGIIAMVGPEKLRRILSKMLDENEFLSPYGIRSLSKYHQQHPFIIHVGGQEYRVDYLAAESDSGMFGGNSNWRGPVWMPINVIIIRALQNYYLYYGDNFKIECPTGSGRWMNLFEVSKEIAGRLTSIFLQDENGRRPVYGGTEKFQKDPHWREYILFYEYFNGDNGAGLGAGHQTGWTGLVAKLIQVYGLLGAKEFLQAGKHGLFKLKQEKMKNVSAQKK